MTLEFCQAVARSLNLAPRHVDRCLTPEATARTVSIVLRTVGSPALVFTILTGCAANGLNHEEIASIIALTE
jgi:hypothetical protein